MAAAPAAATRASARISRPRSEVSMSRTGPSLRKAFGIFTPATDFATEPPDFLPPLLDDLALLEDLGGLEVLEDLEALAVWGASRARALPADALSAVTPSAAALRDFDFFLAVSPLDFAFA